MTEIVTITPNPAVDVSTAVQKIVPVYKLRGAWQRRDPGGGGINVARVLKRLGGDVIAIYPIGGATGDSLRKLVEREGVASSTFATEDETREDFFVNETGSGQQYRFILPGPLLRQAEWQECLNLLSRMEPFPRFVVGSGSLPRGVPDDFYARAASLAKQRGARMILDTSGPALVAAVAEGVYLIKPNLREMRDLTGREPCDNEEWEDAAKDLVQNGKVALVALTMGHLGAALVTRDRILRAAPLAITPVSAAGAGDSFLGALIHGLASGIDLDGSFRLAAAAGAAALLNPGTGLCRSDDVRRLADAVILKSA